MNFSNHGIVIPDCSFWQDDDSTPNKIDFAKMKAAGASGVILRAGQNSWIDEDFRDYWQAAKAAGLPRGSYWFYDSRTEPAKQANLWHAAIGDDLPELGLWTDLEESYHGPFAGEKFWKDFVLCVSVYFPSVKVQGVYTASWWWSSQRVSDPTFWGAFPLWVAQYNVSQADVKLPAPWVMPVLWQFTASSDGARYGVESAEIDLNYFNGDASKFQSFFELSGETEAPQEEGTMATYQGTVLATVELAIREGPGTTYNKLAGLHYGDKVEASNIVEGWWHLTKVNNAIIDGYSFSSNGAWIRTDSVHLPAPEPEPVELPARVGLTFDGVAIKWYVAE